MLSAFGGADALEIVVLLRDLSEKGLKNLEHNLQSVGKTGQASGNALGASFLGIPAPIAIAGAAIAGFTALGAAIIPTYEKVQQQEAALAIAFKTHGESLDTLRPKIEAAIAVGEQYAFNADDTRAAILQLTNANLSFAQIQEALPRIMDLARAKHLSLADATDSYSKAVYGNARALKQFGIILPPVVASMADVGKATDAVKKAQTNLKTAQEELTVVEDKLKGKHHLTAAEALQLQKAHDKVSTATDNLKKAQGNLTLAQQGGIDKAARLKLVNDGLKKSIDDQKSSVTPLQVAQAKLNDTWEKFSTKYGPGFTNALTQIIDKMSILLGWISTAIDRLGDLFNAATNAGNAIAKVIPAGIGNGVGGGQNSGGLRVPLPAFFKASGGPVLPGMTYIVGEKGPETLVMGNSGGYVIPSSPMGGGGAITIHLTHSTILDGREIARSTDRYMHRSLGMAGTGIRRPLGG